MTLEPLSPIYINQAKRLYFSSFPKNERRAWKDILIRNNSRFFNFFCIADNGNFSGIISLWQFNTFIYIEHFAIKKSLRNKGLGSKALNLVKENYNKSIVLEVELPSTDEAIKRIDFYRKNGFILLPNKYIQPPYNNGLSEVEMKIMTSDYIDFTSVKNTLYSKVYNQQI